MKKKPEKKECSGLKVRTRVCCAFACVQYCSEAYDMVEWDKCMLNCEEGKQAKPGLA
jgi:hypothetical protein